jgi:cell fate regulator YaaT (PSP1 superfamily)
MSIFPLPVMSEEAEGQAIANLKPPKTVVVRYGYLRQIGEFPYDGDQILGCGTKLVIRTSRGIEVGEMLTTTCSNSGCGKSVSRQQMLQYIDNSGGKQFPFTTDGRVLRAATVEDLNEQSRLEADKGQYVKLAKEAIRELDLPMKLVEVEPLLSKDKVVFYFLSEDRIDFRELVRRIASEIHVRVEMRQVGARDEARLVADYEKCGQHCCCKQFLKVLKPVSMRSAKVQKATLDPSKISGRCGRLMCCLRYEDETYEELRKKLPNRKTRVMTEDGKGIVINSQILTQLVLVELDSGERAAYPLENIEILTGEAAKMPPRPPVDPTGPGEPQNRGDGRRSGDGRSGRGGDGRGGEGRGGEGRGGEGRGGDGRGDRNRGGERGPASADRRREPQRPSPGRPLDDEHVESAEGDNASQLDDTPRSVARGSGMAKPVDDTRPIDGSSIDHDGHGGDEGNDGIDHDENRLDGGDDSEAGSEGQIAGEDGEPRKRRRRRRRRRRGGSGGENSGDHSGPGPGSGPDGN